MSKAHLAGRQAESSLQRPDGFVLGGFAEDGRIDVVKEYKSGKAAEKPNFFMGGCGPTVPTGPKRKLRASWLADPSPAAEDPHPPMPVGATKRWTPPAKKALPPRAKSHDGTLTTRTADTVRRGRKPIGTKKAPEEETVTAKGGDEKKDEEPVAEKPVVDEEEEDAPPKPMSRSLQPSDFAMRTASPPRPASPKKEEPAWKPDTLLMKKPLYHKGNFQNDDEEETQPVPVAAAPAEPGSALALKDEEIAQLKEEIQRLKAEKGELAKAVKKTKGSQDKNQELRNEIFELKQQLQAAAKADAKSKGFSKLENKLNTLKMILDGRVKMNSLEALQDHVNMLNMIINQDLKMEGMKNVWA